MEIGGYHHLRKHAVANGVYKPLSRLISPLLTGRGTHLVHQLMSKKHPRWCQKPKISKPRCCLKLCEPIIWNPFFSARFLAHVRQGLGAPHPIHHEGKDDVVLGCCGMPSWLGALLAGTPPQNVCWGYPWELATRERCENSQVKLLENTMRQRLLYNLSIAWRLAPTLGWSKGFMAPNMTNPLISYSSQKQRIFFF